MPLVLTCGLIDEQQEPCDLAEGKVSSQEKAVADGHGV
jgi:hypothetical protein